MIKAIIFDCFGVFYVDPTAYFYNLAAQQHTSNQAEKLAELIARTDLGDISQEEFIEQVAIVFSLSPEMVRAKLLTGIARNAELLEYAQTLRSTYKLGMLSNISRGTMNSFFSPQERKELFDDVVLSGEVGVIKPDPRIFLLAAQRLKVIPNETIFIDDNKGNCDGARAAGMQAIHYRTNHQVMHELRELLKN
jgi:putative hydrolase of the HAD superfamily